MDTVTVMGKFLMERKNGDQVPVTGRIQFIPSRLWVEHGGAPWATLGYDELLDGEGGFTATLTPTHGHGSTPWYYTVVCPVGKWSISLSESKKPLQIRRLLPSQFSE